MLKRVNSTGRRRIPRNQIEIEVRDGSPRNIVASIDWNDMKFPGEAKVYLEAMCAGSPLVKRFDIGEVDNLALATSYPLDGIEGENVFFALKVVDKSERIGRILGIAENIKPVRAGKQTATGRRGILPIEQTELGDEIWRLEFREQDVFLLINSKINGLVDRVRTDPVFYAAIYPEIIRRILARAIDEGADIEEYSDSWPQMWLRFGKNLHPQKLAPPHQDNPDEQEEWIEEVALSFCTTHQLRAKFAAALEENGAN